MEQSEIKSKFPSYKDHLNKTFLEELNYKFWTTMGIRFKASQRLLIQNDLSNKALGFLSAYLIILGLLSVYKITSGTVISENLIAFGSTTLSILLLAFSQMESAQDFKIRAKNFHECALRISALYNDLRITKTLENLSQQQKVKVGKELSERYQNVLDNYPNHDDIDYRMFRLEHSKFFELEKMTVWRTKLRYYFQVKLLYHSMILLPPIILISLYFTV